MTPASCPTRWAIVHHRSCSPDYPEKDPGEQPQHVDITEDEDGYVVLSCADCGAFATNLPPEGDPYWDEVKRELGF